jgi:hypothetical protein
LSLRIINAATITPGKKNIFAWICGDPLGIYTV